VKKVEVAEQDPIVRKRRSGVREENFMEGDGLKKSEVQIKKQKKVDTAMTLCGRERGKL